MSSESGNDDNEKHIDTASDQIPCNGQEGDISEGEERSKKETFFLGVQSDEDSSSSETENNILEQVENTYYGSTPPRHVRRMKSKVTKSGKRESKSHSSVLQGSGKEKQKSTHRHKKEYLRKISNEDGFSEGMPRRTPSICVESFDRYRNIRSVPALLNKHHHHQRISNQPKSQELITKSRSFGDVTENQNCPSNRLHFMKTFQLLVKLGDKHGRRDSSRGCGVNTESNDHPEKWQIQFDQVLWLELQAWHHSRQLDEEDGHLVEERKKADSIFDEVIHFHFPTKLEEYEARNTSRLSLDSKIMKGDGDENVDTTSNAHQQHTQIHPQTAHSSNLPFLPHDVDHICSTIDDHFTGSIQRKAMHIIIMLLQKVEEATALYPTSKALAQLHQKFLDDTFVRNYETLNVWLNICKELYHKLQVVASLVDVDAEDVKTWEDWFDHGLGLTCIKTRRTYQTRRHSFRDDRKHEAPNEAATVNDKSNPSSPDSRPQAHKRQSLLRQTSTSRYRSFVEKTIRQIGLRGLSQRLKFALHKTLWKARQALEVPREAHDLMEREHNYGKVIDLIKFLEKMTADDPSQRTVFSSMVLHPDDFKPGHKERHDRGVWCKEFSNMGLPSFLELYLFITKIAFDIIHESIKYRLDHKPKNEPSLMSIRQLIYECKEVICAAIIGKDYYQDMTLSVLTADDKSRIESLDTDINEFEEDVQSVLSVYFSYLQHLFQMLQRLPEASRSLKNTMEEEWQFTKQICPHTKGLEAQASTKFCLLATGLLVSTAEFLESSLDECSRELYDKMDKSSEKVKEIALEACRKHKKLFNEIRERSAKALGFAKMLQKDLGIAAEYNVKVSSRKILELLKSSKHVKVDCKSSEVNYEIYTQKHLAVDKRHIIKLLNVTCGFEDPAEAGMFPNDGYIILLNLNKSEDETTEEKAAWKDKTVHVSPTVDTAIALANIKVDGLMVIACNSYQLFTQRKALQGALGDSITLVNEQTSSHQTVAEALNDFRVAAENLAQKIVRSVKQSLDTLNLETIFMMEQGEKDLVHKSYVETMLLCFNTGFEYLRELARLLSGQSKDLCPLMVEFSKDWMNFISNNTEKGRGRRPRWSTCGFEFITETCNPKNLAEMKEDEFQDIKKDINNCVTHIIGQHAPSPSGSKTGSPTPVLRMKSHPGGGNSPSKAKDRKSSDQSHHSKFSSRKSYSDSFAPSQGCSLACNQGSDSESDVALNSSDGGNSPLVRSSRMNHLDKMRASIEKLERKRTDKLIRKKIIGRISDKKPDLASDLVNIKSRRVNFKWNLGNKIGEGQFGKVYSCVNMESGKLMAMKKIKFDPHDYSSIQDIADEITSIQSLHHESLVEYYGVEVHRGEMLIFMEYCEDGTIAQVAKIGLPEEIIRVYTLQIVKAVRFVHDNGFVHRDIKGANIFVSSSGYIKLGDFGSAVRLRDPGRTMQGEVCKIRGTAAFMAPEVINQKETGYGRASDIWSLGCVVIEMATGKIPWADLEWVAIMYRVGTGTMPCIPECLSEEGKDFLYQCFINDPKERYTAEMLEGHDFVKCER